VHRILVNNGMGRLPANQKHQPHRIDNQEFYQLIDQNGVESSFSGEITRTIQ